MEVTSIKCPNCGAGITPQMRACEWCGEDVLVKSFKSVASMPLPQVNKYMVASQAATEAAGDTDTNLSVGLCFLKLRKYEQAVAAFERAQQDNFDNAAPFFYAAVARLAGRKPFLCKRVEIDKMEEDLNGALMIAPEAIHYYFLSYIGRDFFKRKFIKHEPAWETLMEEAVSNGLSPADVEEFHAMTGTPIDISLD